MDTSIEQTEKHSKEALRISRANGTKKEVLAKMGGPQSNGAQSYLCHEKIGTTGTVNETLLEVARLLLESVMETLRDQA